MLAQSITNKSLRIVKDCSTTGQEPPKPIHVRNQSFSALPTSKLGTEGNCSMKIKPNFQPMVKKTVK
jgi:hypothetical protein